jgi:hypothetical protein
MNSYILNITSYVSRLTSYVSQSTNRIKDNNGVDEYVQTYY